VLNALAPQRNGNARATSKFTSCESRWLWVAAGDGLSDGSPCPAGAVPGRRRLARWGGRFLILAPSLDGRSLAPTEHGRRPPPFAPWSPFGCEKPRWARLAAPKRRSWSTRERPSPEVGPTATDSDDPALRHVTQCSEPWLATRRAPRSDPLAMEVRKQPYATAAGGSHRGTPDHRRHTNPRRPGRTELPST